MADVEDYVSERILRNIKLALLSLKLVKLPLIGRCVRSTLLRKTGNFEPQLINIESAEKLIREASVYAVGERVCRVLHKDSKFTESVFLEI